MVALPNPLQVSQSTLAALRDVVEDEPAYAARLVQVLDGAPACAALAKKLLQHFVSVLC
jgi:hypothetical protein